MLLQPDRIRELTKLLCDHRAYDARTVGGKRKRRWRVSGKTKELR
jgi:hypothetical protein